MHYRLSLATVALMGIGSASVFAQGPSTQPQAAQPQLSQPKQGPTSVALVDVGYLIKNHPTMNGEMEKITEEMKVAQEQIEQRRKELLSQSEAVGRNLDSSSPDFKMKQEQLLNAESKLRVDFMGKEKEFAERQATVIYKSYQDITESINTVAKHYNYDLVVRFSKEQSEMDPKKPATVNFGIQRDVLYQSPGMDVTEIVMYLLKEKYKNVSTPTAQVPRVSTQTTTPNSNSIRK